MKEKWLRNIRWQNLTKLYSSLLWKVALVSRESNDTPLQYSCLENPMDGGAWWAAVYGAA